MRADLTKGSRLSQAAVSLGVCVAIPLALVAMSHRSFSN